jgi:hypothetical protein
VTTTETPYASCQDCGIALADRDAVTAHGSATMAPTGEPGIVARGHRVSILNPTEPERRASRARMHIGDALLAAYEHLYDRAERHEITVDEIKAELWAFDFGDGWDEFLEEVDE